MKEQCKEYKKMNWSRGELWADVMQHTRQPADFPIKLIRGMSAMILEAKASITSSLTDISVVILPDTHWTSRGRARLSVQWKRITQWTTSTNITVHEF